MKNSCFREGRTAEGVYFRLYSPAEAKSKRGRILFCPDLLHDLRSCSLLDLEQLAQKSSCEVLSLDYRGTGQSTALAHAGDPEKIGIADCVTDAVAVMEENKWKWCNLLGHGLGGLVGQELALQHPNKVDRMVLVGCVGGIASCSSELGLRAGSSCTSLPLSWTVCVEYLLLSDKIYTNYLPRMLAYLLLLLQLVMGLHPHLPPPAASSKQLHALVRAFDEYSSFDRLHEIKQRTLLMYGARDQFSPERQVLEMEVQMGAAVAHDFDGGHFFLANDDDAQLQMVDFLRACETNRIDEF